jgi:hypothetical protein
MRLFPCFSSPDLFLLLVFHKVCRFPPCFMGFIRLIWTLSHLSFEIDVVELGFMFIRLFWWILVVLCCGCASMLWDGSYAKCG